MFRFVLSALLAVHGSSQLAPSAIEEISASCPLVGKKCDQVDDACFQSIKTKLSPACLKLYRTAIRDANAEVVEEAPGSDAGSESVDELEKDIADMDWKMVCALDIAECAFELGADANQEETFVCLLEEFQVFLDTGASELSSACEVALDVRLSIIEEQQKAQQQVEVVKVDWRTPCADDLKQCGEEILTNKNLAFACMADEYQLGENSTLSEECTIAIEARSAQSAASQAAAAPVIINKADWMGACTESGDVETFCPELERYETFDCLAIVFESGNLTETCGASVLARSLQAQAQSAPPPPISPEELFVLMKTAQFLVTDYRPIAPFCPEIECELVDEKTATDEDFLTFTLCVGAVEQGDLTPNCLANLTEVLTGLQPKVAAEVEAALSSMPSGPTRPSGPSGPVGKAGKSSDKVEEKLAQARKIQKMIKRAGKRCAEIQCDMDNNGDDVALMKLLRCFERTKLDTVSDTCKMALGLGL